MAEACFLVGLHAEEFHPELLAFGPPYRGKLDPDLHGAVCADDVRGKTLEAVVHFECDAGFGPSVAAAGAG